MAHAIRETYLDLNEAIGQRCRALRDERAWSQLALSRQSGVPQSRISDLEAGRQQWTPKYMEAISIALGVTPADLFPTREAPLAPSLTREESQILNVLRGSFRRGRALLDVAAEVIAREALLAPNSPLRLAIYGAFWIVEARGEGEGLLTAARRLRMESHERGQPDPGPPPPDLPASDVEMYARIRRHFQASADLFDDAHWRTATALALLVDYARAAPADGFPAYLERTWSTFVADFESILETGKLAPRDK